MCFSQLAAEHKPILPTLRTQSDYWGISATPFRRITAVPTAETPIRYLHITHVDELDLGKGNEV
jgi:hypothetical protein